MNEKDNHEAETTTPDTRNAETRERTMQPPVVASRVPTFLTKEQPESNAHREELEYIDPNSTMGGVIKDTIGHIIEQFSNKSINIVFVIVNLPALKKNSNNNASQEVGDISKDARRIDRESTKNQEEQPRKYKEEKKTLLQRSALILQGYLVQRSQNRGDCSLTECPMCHVDLDEWIARLRAVQTGLRKLEQSLDSVKERSAAEDPASHPGTTSPFEQTSA